MADIYVNSAATGSNNGTSWDNAYTSITSVSASNGDRVLVLDTHYENITVSTVLAFGTSKTNLVHILSVNAALECVAGARIRGPGNSNLTINGCFYIFGIDLSSEGYGSNSFAGMQGNYCYLESCKFGGDTGAGGPITFGGYNVGKNESYLKNCEWKITGASSYMDIRMGFMGIYGGIASVTNTPPTLPFRLGNGASVSISAVIDGMDLSGLATTTTLLTTGGGNYAGGAPLVSRCKLPSGWTGLLSNDAALRAVMDACDDGTSVLRSQSTCAQGSNYTDTTVVRTSGAKVNGTPMSYRMSSSANINARNALDSRQLFRAYPGTDAEDVAFVAGAPVTVTVEVLSNAALTNAQCWLEVTSFDVSGSVIGVTKSNERAGVTATPVAQPSSSAAWSTGAVSTPTKQKLQVTVNPQHKGYITAVVKLAEPSSAVYLCPQMDIS